MLLLLLLLFRLQISWLVLGFSISSLAPASLRFSEFASDSAYQFHRWLRYVHTSQSCADYFGHASTIGQPCHSIQWIDITTFIRATPIDIMPFSNAQRKQIISTLSSIVEHSFLDDTAHDAVVGVVPSPKPTRQIKRPTSKTSKKDTNHHFRSFIVVYTMIFFNGCE